MMQLYQSAKGNHMHDLARIITITLLAVAFSGCDNNAHHIGHSQHNATHTMPVEVGQDSFAAIAEIVGMLRAAPETDWSTVNINALREHLLAMDRLVKGATVEEQAINNGIRFNVTGNNLVLNAIQQMVPAHTAELDKMPEFNATTEAIESGIALIITGKDEVTLAQIKGLGFFGLMATGPHHQAHHYMMATGQGHGMHH